MQKSTVILDLSPRMSSCDSFRLLNKHLVHNSEDHFEHFEQKTKKNKKSEKVTIRVFLKYITSIVGIGFKPEL